MIRGATLLAAFACAAAIVSSAPPNGGPLQTPSPAPRAARRYASLESARSAMERLRFPISPAQAAPTVALEDLLTLRHVIGGQGAIVILRADASEAWVKPGSRVPGLDAVLVELQREAAVFEWHGRHVRLTMGESGAPRPPLPQLRGPYILLHPRDAEWFLANLDLVLSQIRLVPNEAGQGLRIERIAAGSIWERCGLMVGDVILRVNQHEASDLRRLRAALESDLPNQVSILLQRGGRQIMRVVRLLPE